MLSEEEAVSFVRDTLGIPDPKEKVSQDPYQFLKDLMPAFIARIPFQNLTLMSIQPELRQR